MEQREDAMELLDVMVPPGFCVQNNIIVKVNDAARNLLVEPGTDVRNLLLTGREEYDAFRDGCLYLTLRISGQSYSVSVLRRKGFDLFIFQQEEDLAELQTMALVSREMRGPLASVMTTAQQLYPLIPLQEDSATQDLAAQLNRGLMQMLRIISNMSDACRYSTLPEPRMETREICGFLEEIFSGAAQRITHGDIRLTFRNLPGPVYGLIDPERLERAVLNILSNAMKFTPKGGTIDAALTRSGNTLRLQVTDSGSGIAEHIKSTLHCRYLRAPAIEDGRFGLGLGMVLIRSAAACHGGTLLVDQPDGSGTRVTMTLAIRQNTDHQVRSDILRVDYAGERDHTLLELADSLPASLYKHE